MFCVAFLATLSVSPGAEAEPTGYVIESKPVKRVEAILQFGMRHDGIRADEWVLFVPQAPELPGQSKVRTRTNLKSDPVVVVQGDLRRVVLRSRVPTSKKPDFRQGFEITVTYEATLQSRKLRPLGADASAPRVVGLTGKDRAAYLAAVGDMDYRADEFRAWQKESKLTRAGGEGDVEFARRVFLAIARGRFKYAIRGEMDRSAAGVCKAGAGDCGGLSALFCATLRSEGVPARLLCGRWAQSSPPDRSNNRTHVKAEFYARGVGWVPVDPAAGLVFDRSPEGLKYFGDDPGDFLVQHVDTRFEVDTIHFGKQKVNNLQTPSSWTVGKPADSGMPKFHDVWEVTETK